MHRWVFILLAIIGAAVFVYGAVADPFAVPFQDFEELPAHVKEQYFRAAKYTSYLRYGGGTLVVFSLVGFLLSSARKRPNKSP